jgi:hypothetical protein
MSEKDSIFLVHQHQPKLNLTDRQFTRWTGKRYIILIEVANVEAVSPFAINKSNFENMDNWLLAERIETIRR